MSCDRFGFRENLTSIEKVGENRCANLIWGDCGHCVVGNVCGVVEGKRWLGSVHNDEEFPWGLMRKASPRTSTVPIMWFLVLMIGATNKGRFRTRLWRWHDNPEGSPKSLRVDRIELANNRTGVCRTSLWKNKCAGCSLWTYKARLIIIAWRAFSKQVNRAHEFCK